MAHRSIFRSVFLLPFVVPLAFACASGPPTLAQRLQSAAEAEERLRRHRLELNRHASDINVSHSVQNSLVEHPDYDSSRISHHVSDGVVTLKGVAPNAAARDRLVELICARRLLGWGDGRPSAANPADSLAATGL